MSQLGKILLGVAAAGAVVALVFGFLVIGKYNDAKTNLDQANQTNVVAKQEVATAKKAAEAAAAAEADAEGKLTASNSKVDDLNTQLKAATQKADDAAKALEQAQSDGAKAVSDLAEINKELNGQTVGDIIAARDKALQDIQSNQAEQKIISDQLQASQNQVAQLTKDLAFQRAGTNAPGVSGKVTFVNRTWNFVVLDVGLSNGVVPNGELIVYRKNNFLGKIKVTTADANSAVADILPDVKGDIQVGDYVLN